jgi:hypothetical protein
VRLKLLRIDGLDQTCDGALLRQHHLRVGKWWCQ